MSNKLLVVKPCTLPQRILITKYNHHDQFENTGAQSNCIPKSSITLCDSHYTVQSVKINNINSALECGETTTECFI